MQQRQLQTTFWYLKPIESFDPLRVEEEACTGPPTAELFVVQFIGPLLA